MLVKERPGGNGATGPTMKACDFRRTWAFTRNWGLFGFFLLIIYLFMAALDLGCCAFSIVAIRGYFSLWCMSSSLQWLLLLLQ